MTESTAANKPAATTVNGHPKPQSLSERYHSAVCLVESKPQESIALLESIQLEIARLSLFSANESLEDISSKALPLLALEHHLAMAYTNLPTGPGDMAHRKRYISKAMDLWAAFLQKLEDLGDENVLSKAEKEEFHALLEVSSSNQEDGGDAPTMSALPAPRREDKIARFRAKQQASQEVERLKSLRERRQRLGLSSEEILDDTDEETLERTVAMTQVLLCKADALEQWAQSVRELPMIDRMAQMEAQRRHNDRHSGTNNDTNRSSTGQQQQSTRPPTPASGIQVTHINLDSATGKLLFRKEEVRSQVFRPGWNQPTMSLEELGDRERAEAIERQQRQSEAESKQLEGSRRYDQLVKDGREDDANAVDASASLDRAWDDWKDENPRGSGNKRGDVGDRNF